MNGYAASQRSWKLSASARTDGGTPEHVIQTARRLDAVCAALSSPAVGIDVAEPRKGLDLVALDRDRGVLARGTRLSVSDAVSLTLSIEPGVVCIDSPSAWSTSGRSRFAERELARIRIQSYRTGPDPGDHPFYRWMRVGFELFERLAPAYSLYRGGDPTGCAAEVFPHATACLLAGRLREPATPKHVFRERALRRAGVRSPLITSPDQIDAALAALTGLIALEGGHCAVGDPDEGVILLPGPRLPDEPLTAAKS
jgi:predicted nuclease with RNAse H fold